MLYVIRSTILVQSSGHYKEAGGFHTDRELVNLYKGRVLQYLQYRTAAVYHANCTTPQPLKKCVMLV